MNKLNVYEIVVAHLDTLRDYKTGNRDWPAIGIFFGVPLIVAALSVYRGWGLYMDALNALIAAFAIFAGLLLNLLILIYTFSTTATYPSALAKVRTQFVKELHANVSFSVLDSIAIVLAAFVAVAELKIRNPLNASPHTGVVMTFLLVYLSGNFVLTLVMILKRIHSLLRTELEQAQAPKLKAS